MAMQQTSEGVAHVEHSIEIVDALKTAYNMELETVVNYLTTSINLDGVRAEEIKDALQDDINTELGHARSLAMRIKVLGGIVPGSQSLKFDQNSLQPSDDTTDVARVVRGVIDAEDRACVHYQKLIQMCDGIDYVTQDVCIKLLTDEEEHRREFQGFLKEYE